MQKTQFTLRQYVGKDNVAKMFGQDMANDESFINRRVIFINEQNRHFVGSNGNNKRFEFQIDGTFKGFVLKCGLTPENRDILYGPDIPLLKREQRNVEDMGAIEYSYHKDKNRIDVSWVDTLSRKYNIPPYAVAVFGNDEKLYETLNKYYLDIKDPRILKAFHEQYDVDYLIDIYMPKDFRDAVSGINAGPEKYRLLAEIMEQNFMNGKQSHQEVIDMSTAFNDEPNKDQIYMVKRIYNTEIDFDIAQMEQVIFVTEDPAIALAYVQKYNNIQDNSTFTYGNDKSTYTVDVISFARDNDILRRSPRDVLEGRYMDIKEYGDDIEH